MKKVSDAQRRANDKWDERNKERKNYINKRSVARNFIKNMEGADFQEFKQLINEKEMEIMYIVNVELVKDGKFVEVNFDHHVATTKTREEALEAIDEDKDRFAAKDADELLYLISTATEEEIEEGEYDLDTNDSVTINLKGGDTLKNKLSFEKLTAVHYDKGSNVYDLEFEVDTQTVFIQVDASDHEEAAQDEDYFEDEALIDDIIEYAKEEDIDVQ